MADDLSADSNTFVTYWDVPQTVAVQGSGVTSPRLLMVYVQATADATDDFVDLNDMLPGGNVTILVDLGRTGPSAQDSVYVTWSSDRVVFANNGSTSEINRVLLLVSVA